MKHLNGVVAGWVRDFFFGGGRVITIGGIVLVIIFTLDIMHTENCV